MNIRATINQVTDIPVCDVMDEEHGFEGEYGELPGVVHVSLDGPSYERNGESYFSEPPTAEVIAFDMGGLILDRDALCLLTSRAAVQFYEEQQAEIAAESM